MKNTKTKVKSSMPRRPAVAGKTWTRKNATRVRGRWLLIGWLDAPAQVVLCVGSRHENEIMGWDSEQQVFVSFDPDQVISVGHKLDDSEFVLGHDGEWYIEG